MEVTVRRHTTQWTKDSVIRSILARALEGAPLGFETVRPKSLAKAGTELFGSWQAAMVAAGLRTSPQGSPLVKHLASEKEPPLGQVPSSYVRPGQVWTPQGVMDAIQLRLRQGKAINSNAVYDDHRSLYRAAERLFGNWGKALCGAGLDPAEFQKGVGNRKTKKA